MVKPRKKIHPHKHSTARFHGVIFVLGIIGAIMLAQSGLFDQIIEFSSSLKLAGAFITGIFFTSLLTTPAATVVFYQLAQSGTPILPVAIVGALGAVIGDLLIFRFLQFGMGDEITHFFESHAHGFKRLVRYRFFSITMIVFGAMIIMSPLPDELGLTLMQIGHIRPKLLAGISFVFNAFGILLIALIAKGLAAS